LFRTNPILAVRDGRLFVAAQGLDSLAIGLASVALPWLVLQGGGSHAQAGLVYSLTVIPYVLFGLTAGSVGDRLPGRTVMLCGHAVQAACSAVIPLWTIAGTPPVGVVLAVAFAVGSGRVFADAAAFGAVALMVGPERFAEGQGAVSAAWSLGLFAGPALGGALVSAVGPARALGAEAAALAVAALLVAAVRTSFARADGETAGSVREGLRFIAHNRGIASYTLVIVAWNLVASGAFALLVPLLRDGVGLSSGSVGAILATGSIAAFTGSIVAARVSRRYGAAVVFCFCVLATAVAIAVLGLAGGFAVALVGVLVYLLVEGLVNVVAIGERQRRAPHRLQGRVGIAGRMVALGAMAGGSALASALTRAVGLAHLYIGMGVATALVAALAAPLLLRLED
jgi:MFS family permease